MKDRIVNVTENNGIFYSTESALAEETFPLPLSGGRTAACYRAGSCWMRVAFAGGVGGLPRETQYVLTETESGYRLAFALADGAARSSFYSEGGAAFCRAETGDPSVPLGRFAFMYTVDCADPYEGIEIAHRDLSNRFGYSLKRDKKTPDFINRIGYCTYNAFYSDVDGEKILSAARAFVKGGVTPGFLIVDEGWMTSADGKLASFYADPAKFPEGMKAVADECKRECGLKDFFLWHTFDGYWRGVDGAAFPEYEVSEETFSIPERLLGSSAGGFSATVGDDFYPMNIAYKSNGICVGDIARVYDDFYRAMKEQGADGTKIDAVTWVEAFSSGKGGRLAAMRKLLAAYEGASDRYFGSARINCSSCSNDFFTNIGTGTVVRTSPDYMPDKPGSHPEHVMINAFVGFFLSPEIIPDWDMFGCYGEWGEYHAAARAVSGGPVYCTGKPEEIDFSIVKKLCCKDGFVGRCEGAAVPLERCLFGAAEGEPFAVTGKTAHALVLAAFGAGSGATKASYSPAEAGADDGEYAVYSSRRGFIGKFYKDGNFDCALEAGEAEIFTIARVRRGVAVIGLTDKYNPSAFITFAEDTSCGVRVGVAEEGTIGAYTDGIGYAEYPGKSILLNKGESQ